MPIVPLPPGRLGERGSAATPVALVVGFGLFVIAIVYILISSAIRPEAAVFDPTPVDPTRPYADTLVLDTVTVDARTPEEWRFFTLSRGTVLPVPDTMGWDLAIRRFNVIASGEVADLGDVVWDSVRTAPTDGYHPTEIGRDTSNLALERWYSYNLLTHVMEPNGHVFAVRTREGRFAKMRMLSYYCTGMQAGCLTLEYVYQPNGTRRLQ